jgi:hypothetical protein
MSNSDVTVGLDAKDITGVNPFVCFVERSRASVFCKLGGQLASFGVWAGSEACSAAVAGFAHEIGVGVASRTLEVGA